MPKWVTPELVLDVVVAVIAVVLTHQHRPKRLRS
jgi:hypothetical protein